MAFVMCRAPNSLFCGNHRPVTETDSLPSRVLKKAKREGQETIIRIPCPIDNSHTIFQHDLEHHVKICNTAARTAEMKSQPFYCENCNSGFNTDTLPLREVDCEELVKKIRRIYSDDVAPFVSEPAETTVTIPSDKIIQAVAGSATSFQRVRHARQNVDIVRQMVAANLLVLDEPSCRSSPGNSDYDAPLTYVELGAGLSVFDFVHMNYIASARYELVLIVRTHVGKGMLGLAVKSASRPDSQLVLVIIKVLYVLICWF